MAVLNIILGLLENQIEVYVVASKPPKEFQKFLDRIRNKGAKLILISSDSSGLRYWKELAEKSIQVIIENDIEVVHLHLPKLIYVLGKKIKNLDKKLVLTVEGDPIYEVQNLGLIEKIKTWYMWKKCIRYPDILCPCSEWLSEIIKQRDKISNIKTIHNPIDIERFENADAVPRAFLGIHDDELVIITAARLTAVKSIDVLIKGFANFIENTSIKSSLLILGDGEQKKELEELTQKLNINERVMFLGFKNNPENYISMADIFVMTSNYEPFGMPAAEAGALGIPVIASKAGGLKEIIIHEKTGYQFDVGDFKQLASYLEELSTKETRMMFGKNSREHIMTNFSPKIIGYKIIQLYNKLTS